MVDEKKGKRLIYAEDLKKAVRMWPRTKQPVLFYYGTILKGIDEAPTVDAVEVVRCSKCDWYNRENEKCGFWPDEGYRHPNHYCSEGRMRADG